jgi:hypothetical protein
MCGRADAANLAGIIICECRGQITFLGLNYWMNICVLIVH